MRAFALTALFAAGCTAHAAGTRTVERDDPLLDDASMDDRGAWQSAPWSRSEWIPYPGRGSVVIAHPLGRIPTGVQVYLSPDSDDRETENSRIAFIASGDIATLTGVDDEYVAIENNTRGDFFARVVVH